MFENDVKMYGIQTLMRKCITQEKFENDVKMYGIQTTKYLARVRYRLRMM